MKNIRRRLFALVVIGVATLFAPIFTAQSAQAAIATVNVYNGAGQIVATGQITALTWVSAYRADPVNFTLQDPGGPGCDGRGVYSYWKVWDHGSNSPWTTTKRTNYKGCGTTPNTYNSYINDGLDLLAVQYWVCRDDGICNSSSKYYNPNW